MADRELLEQLRQELPPEQRQPGCEHPGIEPEVWAGLLEMDGSEDEPPDQCE